MTNRSAGKSLRELADILSEITPTECLGDSSVIVTQVVHPRYISGPQDLILALDPHALPALQHPAAKAAVITSEVSLSPELLAQPGHGYLRVERTRLALAKLLEIFNKPVHIQPGIHPTAVIEPSAQVAPSATVGPLSYIGENVTIGENTIILPHVTVGADAQIGRDCLLHPGVRIGERVIVGNRVILHHNTSIGSDGFSYVTPEPGSVESARSSGKVDARNMALIKINSIGHVILEDDVEVGACATIDRANVGATIIKKGAKIDNLVMIAHNNTIGENCLIVAQAGIAGSCQIGDRAVLAGQVGIKDHTVIGEDAILMAQAGVMTDIKPKEIFVGTPAIPQRQFFQQIAYLGKLKEMRKELALLKVRLAELEGRMMENQTDMEPEETIAI